MTNILQKVSKKLHDNHLIMATAESCTGGWVAKQITDLDGSSAIFDRGFVTYSNEAKQDMLGVSKKTLDGFGAVSEEVALEMVAGAISHSKADIAVAISGIAGPAGGTELKPVGTVCFAWVMKGKDTNVETVIFNGDRDRVRRQAVDYSFNGIVRLIDDQT